jgi:RecB family exonuclease
LTQLNVTAFRDYQACPYRFYLRHVLRLEPIDDSPREMDGRAFGNVAHDVLKQFACSPECNSSNPHDVEEILQHELNQCVQRRYGDQALPAVRVQIEQLRIRLRAFAAIQAARAAEGWRIEFTELSPPPERPATLIVDGIPFQLRGRIDRIDVHAQSGARVIWDYKTSDTVKKPEETHQQQGEWIDLQLPLYRHLALAAGITGPVQLGYILLPKDTGRTAMICAEWDEKSLSAADHAACDIVRCLRREEFWPPARKPPPFSEIFAAICQDTVLGRSDDFEGQLAPK